jgi:hypothetical protein
MSAMRTTPCQRSYLTDCSASTLTGLSPRPAGSFRTCSNCLYPAATSARPFRSGAYDIFAEMLKYLDSVVEEKKILTSTLGPGECPDEVLR